VPENLAREIQIGTAVVAPLSGYSRLGIVVGFEEAAGDRSPKKIRATLKEFSLPEGLVKLCGWAAGAAALPLHATLRMALLPGLAINSYEVRHPAPDWPWKPGSVVSRSRLRRALGGEGLKIAERVGRASSGRWPRGTISNHCAGHPGSGLC
jgi:primosomal protein N'